MYINWAISHSTHAMKLVWLSHFKFFQEYKFLPLSHILQVDICPLFINKYIFLLFKCKFLFTKPCILTLKTVCLIRCFRVYQTTPCPGAWWSERKASGWLGSVSPRTQWNRRCWWNRAWKLQSRSDRSTGHAPLQCLRYQDSSVVPRD